MEDSVLNIKDTYNKAIEVCQYSPHSYSSATNPTVCGIEQIIGRTVADGVREKYISSLQHAADMGIELCKAELALKNDLKYIQDKDLTL